MTRTTRSPYQEFPILKSKTEYLFHYDFHPPEEVRIFTIPTMGLCRWDEEVLIYDVLIGDLVLRHFSFSNEWFQINCTLDRSGQLVIEPGPIEWCFNCDISTPYFVEGTSVYNVDLFLDVLVGTDGHRHLVTDEDEFENASANMWITAEEQTGARRGLAALLEIIETQGLISCLERLYPFGAVLAETCSPAMIQRHMSEVRQFQSSVRHRLYR